MKNITPRILVIGSSNTDMVIQSNRIPRPGETILGGRFFMNPGGKGANQAVAAARLGGNVLFMAKVGNDIFGNKAKEHFDKEGIDTSVVITDHENPSGVALITVDSKGENAIVVAPGSNSTLSVVDIDANKHVLQHADIIIMQLEIPVQTVAYVAQLAKAFDKKVILNPAPAALLPDEVYDKLFLITPNEVETEMLSGIKLQSENDYKNAALYFNKKGVQHVIFTLGNKGAYINCEAFTGIIPSSKVNAVDTTAAGDVFNGALGVALAEGKDMRTAVRFACQAAAISVTRNGAQASAPYRNEVEN